MRILEQSEFDNKNQYVCHIDETKYMEDGVTPDPAYVEVFDWGVDIPTESAQIEMLRLCEFKKAQLNGTPIPDTTLLVLADITG